jgi:hypothetical protein
MRLETFIQDNLPDGNETVRRDCPVCHKVNTFTISRVNGRILWNCYSAGCKIKGVKQFSRTTAEIRERVRQNYHDFYHTDFAVPESFTIFTNNPQAVDYVRRNNCMKAYHNRFADIMYDSKQNRVVFMIKNNHSVCDAVGRGLNKFVKPKWYRYGKSNRLFTCPESDVGVLVEDAASACAISPVATGIALLGTNLRDVNIPELRKFKHIHICLDPDATRKSLSIQSHLSYYVSCDIVRLEDDLKYFSPEEIRKLVLKNK